MPLTSADQKFLDQFSEPELAAILWRVEWLDKAHKHQKRPDGDWWKIWLLMAGRGAGKSRTAAEETGWLAWSEPKTRHLVAAPTSGDLRDVAFEGESGLLNVIPRVLIKDYNRSLHELMMVNGSLIKGIPASEPDRFRGPNWHSAWLEEAAAWQYLQEAFDMIALSLRLGKQPRMIITTTPKPRPLMRDLIKREGKDVVVTRATTYDNLANLAPTFRDQILRFEGTRLGDQEVKGLLLDPEEAGIIKRSQIRLWPAKKALPMFGYIVMSLDTAFTEGTRDKKTGDTDPTACQVWGTFTFEKKTNVMLLDAWQEHLGLPELVKRVQDEMKSEYGQSEEPLLKPMFGTARYNMRSKKVDLLLIEDKGSGISLRQFLERDGISAYAYNPGRADKLTRLHMVSHLFTNGLVWMVESERNEGRPRTWAEPVLDQLVSFSGEGSIPHDDHIDAASQALRLLSDRNMLKVTKGEPLEPVAPRAPVRNPYDA